MIPVYKSKASRSIVNIILLMVSSIVAFLVFEFFVRIFIPQNLERTVPGLYETSENLGYKMTPYYNQPYSRVEYSTQVRTNSLGFRDKEYNMRTGNTVRVMVLGDSFMVSMGVDYEQMFTTQLESMLNMNKRELKYEVVNAGTDGYHPYQYLKTLHEYGNEIMPDIVLVAFYIENDFFLRKIDHESVQGELLNRNKSEEFSIKNNILYPINQFLEAKSHAFLLLRVRLDNLLWKLGLRPYEFPDVFKREWTDTTNRYWKDTQQTIIELSNYSRDTLGADFGVVLIPTIYQIDDNVWEKNLNIFSISPDSVDSEKPNMFLREFFEANRIKYLDLLDGFKAQCCKEKLYYPIDRHWNIKGNMLAAELTYSFIDEKY